MKRQSQDRDSPLIVVQRNPVSGSGRGREELRRCLRLLGQNGYRVRLFRSREKLDEFISSPDTRRRLRCIVAAGGDGTVADLMNRHTHTPLAVFPLGTENLVAKYLGIPLDADFVCQMIQEGHQVQLDAATANGRSFLLMLSAGADAEVVRRLHASRTGNISKLQYVWPIVSSLTAATGHRIRAVSADGKHSAEGGHVIVTNIPAYGFGFQFAPSAVPDDGLLDVRVVRSTSRFGIATHAMTLRMWPTLVEQNVERFRCDALTIEPVYPQAVVPAQADGDPLPPLPASIQVARRQLHLIVPRTFTERRSEH